MFRNKYFKLFVCVPHRLLFKRSGLDFLNLIFFFNLPERKSICESILPLQCFFHTNLFFCCTFCTNLRSVMFSAKQLFLITANRPEIIIVFISLRRFIFTFSFVLLFIFQINISPRISERGSGQVLTGFNWCLLLLARCTCTCTCTCAVVMVIVSLSSIQTSFPRNIDGGFWLQSPLLVRWSSHGENVIPFVEQQGEVGNESCCRFTPVTKNELVKIIEMKVFQILTLVNSRRLCAPSVVTQGNDTYVHSSH